MRKVTILLLLLSMAFIANAQQDLPKFPLVQVEELLNKSYPKDSTAEAYIMSNYGNSWVYENADGRYEIAYQHFVRIKILKKSAFKRATKVIYLYQGNNGQDIEQALEIKGRTYNFNNGAIEMEEIRDKDVFKSSYNKSYDKVSFTLPKVKEGSIIEYSYLIRSPFPFKPNDWDFQTDIPCERSEYIFGSPTNFAYRMLMQSCEGKLAEEKCSTFNNYRSCRWLMLDIPAMKNEKYVANLDDYTRKLHFELAEYILRGMDSAKKLSMDWPDFDKQLLMADDFGGRIGKVSAFDATAQNLKAQKSDSLEI